jgi:hypothetical protein
MNDSYGTYDGRKPEPPYPTGSELQAEVAQLRALLVQCDPFIDLLSHQPADTMDAPPNKAALLLVDLRTTLEKG